MTVKTSTGIQLSFWRVLDAMDAEILREVAEGRNLTEQAIYDDYREVCAERYGYDFEGAFV